MTKLLIFDAFTLLICEKNVANYALLRCKTFSLKIWLCKFFDKYYVCPEDMPKISLKHSQEKVKICPRYGLDILIHAHDIPKICPKYSQEMALKCPRYGLGVPIGHI